MKVTKENVCRKMHELLTRYTDVRAKHTSACVAYIDDEEGGEGTIEIVSEMTRRHALQLAMNLIDSAGISDSTVNMIGGLINIDLSSESCDCPKCQRDKAKAQARDPDQVIIKFPESKTKH